MDTALVSPEAVALLSRITGQKLSQRQLTPPIIFLAALVTVLLGVMLADGTVTDEEKQQLQAILDNLTSSESKLGKLAQLLIKGVKQHQVYKKLDQLTTLTIPLSEAEKLLVISFGYKMLANAKYINSRETSYLQSITNQLGVNSKYLAVLESGFSGQETINLEALQQFYSFLNPASFQSVDPLFVNAASYILTELPAIPPYLGNQAVKSYSLELQQFATKIKESIQVCLNELDQAETVLNTKPQILEVAKQEILEQLGECSGRDIRIRRLGEQRKLQVAEQAKKSWEERIERLRKKWFIDAQEKQKESIGWGDKDGFIKEIQPEVEKYDNYIGSIIKEKILPIYEEIDTINVELLHRCVNLVKQQQKQGDLSTKINLNFFKIKFKFNNPTAHLPNNTKVFDTPIKPTLDALVNKGWGNIYWEEVIKFKNEGISIIDELVTAIFDDRVKLATQAVTQAISFYDDFLERQERYKQETPEQGEAEKAWIAQQRQELEKVQNNIEIVLSMPSS
ncbi:MAG: hypothetical protein RID53_07580 [Coleofasciculus sp. B1-GNL1-01]|uniref:hypothetical protein n=1 Tax=Coleofasciculus sp. B1-GNL1-01 TaxID=3068484 RepID=UPI0032FE0F78